MASCRGMDCAVQHGDGRFADFSLRCIKTLLATGF